LSAGLALIVALVVWRYHNALLNRLATLSLRRIGWRNYRYRMGLEAIAIHLLLALPVPLLLAGAGWLLARVEGDRSRRARAVGRLVPDRGPQPTCTW
jgi:hypothetical protein